MNTAKWMLVGLLTGFLASTAVSCGPAVKACGPKECPFGCCDAAGSCQAGVSDAQCGAQGAACGVCGLAQRCNLGTCTNIGSSGGGGGSGGGSGGGFVGGGSGGGGGVTGGGTGGGATGGGTGGGTTGGGTGGGATGGGGGTCDGCFYMGTCVPLANSNTAIACGRGGITCVSCSGTQTCQNYVCSSGTGGGSGGGGGTTCSSSNCSGCCSGNTCVPLSGNNDTVCGFGGSACMNCAASAGTCNLSTYSCDFAPPDAGGACMGCLTSTNACIPFSTSYQSNATCGGGGDLCQACSGNVCEGGNCGAPTGTVVGNTRVRLVAGNGVNSGRLEVFANGGWGQVCDDSFDVNLNGPNVVCRDLGFAGAVSQANDPGNGNFFLLDDVACTGSEAQLLQCPHSPPGVHNCSSTEAVFITCGP